MIIVLNLFMDTTAITYWNGIVSPLYDAAACILIVPSNGPRLHVDTAALSLQERASLLKGKMVQTLICGAISIVARDILTSAGIAVHPWICGPVDEILQAFANGKLGDNRFQMPGCRCRRRRNGSTLRGRISG
ncbi:MAG: hypothetical protein JW795_15560 [Chitinivibrionales bacterium]|nr:hypothetical protein [Chitinivibrionales bacterium]